MTRESVSKKSVSGEGNGQGKFQPLIGMVAATHTPFGPDGELNLAAVAKQAEHLLAQGVTNAFIGGSTGECHSLTVEERRQLCQRWMAVARGTAMRVVVHVGGNCLTDSAHLAEQAQKLGAAAIAAMSPSYFKPRTLDALIDCCRLIAAAAPDTAFYFYDIPAMTGVTFSMPEFLEKAHGRIASLAGLKFTSADMMAYQRCLRAAGGRLDILWGIDEYLLGALALGACGWVGSTYNFAPAVYHRMIDRFAQHDLAAAREEQFRSVRLVQVLAGMGYMGAAKALMKMIGVDVGPARLPHGNPSSEQVVTLRNELEAMGYFQWINP